MKKRDYVSFSSMKTYQECPYGFKLKYVDEIIKFDKSIYTAFGSAIHETNEKKVLDNTLDERKYFTECFRKELKEIPREVRDEKYPKEMMLEFKEQGLVLASMFLDEMDKLFPDGYKVFDVEEKLRDKIPDFELYFLGFVDLIVKDLKTEKYWIIDYKSCSWGWDSRKKTEKLVVYQLSLYKYFWSKKHNIPPEQIETGFLLLKRTAKKDQIEMIRVTNGEKRIGNALKMLQNTIKLMSTKLYIKNLLHCKDCWFKKECQESRKNKF